MTLHKRRSASVHCYENCLKNIVTSREYTTTTKKTISERRPFRQVARGIANASIKGSRECAASSPKNNVKIFPYCLPKQGETLRCIRFTQKKLTLLLSLAIIEARPVPIYHMHFHIYLQCC